jgi:hypothetical protein
MRHCELVKAFNEERMRLLHLAMRRREDVMAHPEDAMRHPEKLGRHSVFRKPTEVTAKTIPATRTTRSADRRPTP